MSSNGHIEDIRNKGRSIRRVSEETPGREIEKRPKPAVKAADILDAQYVRPKATTTKYPHNNSKFNRATIDIILDAVRAGNYFTTAAQLAGISVATIYRWISMGKENEDENDEHHRFYLALMEAEAQAEAGLVHTVSIHAMRDWRPGMELLSRRFPERWSAKSQQQLTGPTGGPLELVIVYEDDDE